jgi:hypothetical protein
VNELHANRASRFHAQFEGVGAIIVIGLRPVPHLVVERGQLAVKPEPSGRDVGRQLLDPQSFVRVRLQLDDVKIP